VIPTSRERVAASRTRSRSAGRRAISAGRQDPAVRVVDTVSEARAWKPRSAPPLVRRPARRARRRLFGGEVRTRPHLALRSPGPQGPGARSPPSSPPHRRRRRAAPRSRRRP
jgi:hypothetical protein